MTDFPAYSQMDLGEMFRRYNDEAKKRGVALMRVRPKDRGAMGKALAMLLAQPKRKAAPPAAPVVNVPARVLKYNEVRAVAIEELCRIEYFEVVQTGRKVTPEEAAGARRADLQSFGFPYAEVLKRAKKRLPDSEITGPKLRVHATNIRSRKAGYEGARLPDRRPHSSKGLHHG